MKEFSKDEFITGHLLPGCRFRSDAAGTGATGGHELGALRGSGAHRATICLFVFVDASVPRVGISQRVKIVAEWPGGGRREEREGESRGREKRSRGEKE
eukprot:1567355-Heterocapsa_arctica.AAC.1